MENNYQKTRNIKVFISSTFQDMQEERDFLINKIFPKLRYYCGERNIAFSTIDLRWGITAEQSQEGKVTKICLKEIENTSPFFIGLLGHRYGWIPSLNDIIKNDPDVLDDYPWLRYDLKNELSLTEIEMQFGALRNNENKYACFFISSPETTIDSSMKIDEEDKAKLENLKKQVLSQTRYPVEEYDSLKMLGQHVEAHFIKLIDTLFPDGEISEYEKLRLVQESFISSRTGVYIGNQKYEDILNSFIRDKEQKLIITGDRGCGKSALLANWIKKTVQKNEETILPYFIGNNILEAKPIAVIDFINKTIAEKFPLQELSFLDKLDDSLLIKKRKCEKALEILSSKGKSIVLVIDALDQLTTNNEEEKINWLPKLPAQVKLILSIAKNDSLLETLQLTGYKIFSIGPLRKNEKHLIISNILKGYGKSLSEKQNSILVNSELTNSPLILTTILNEIITFGVYERLDERLNLYMSANTDKEFFDRVLIHLEEIYGYHQMKYTFSSIAESLRGLSPEELQEIYRISPLDWSYVFYGIKHFLIQRNELLYFFHDIFKEAVMSRYYRPGTAVGDLNGECYEYIFDSFRPQVMNKNASEKTVVNYLHKVEETLNIWINNCFDDYEERKIQELLSRTEVHDYLYKNNLYLLCYLIITINSWQQRDWGMDDENEFIKNNISKHLYPLRKMPRLEKLKGLLRLYYTYTQISDSRPYYISFGRKAMELLRYHLNYDSENIEILQTYIDLLQELGRDFFFHNENRIAKIYYDKAFYLIDKQKRIDKNRYWLNKFNNSWYLAEYYNFINKLDLSEKYFNVANTVYKKHYKEILHKEFNYAEFLIGFANLYIRKSEVKKAIQLLNKGTDYLSQNTQQQNIQYLHLNILCHKGYYYILIGNKVQASNIKESIRDLSNKWHIDWYMVDLNKWSVRIFYALHDLNLEDESMSKRCISKIAKTLITDVEFNRLRNSLNINDDYFLSEHEKYVKMYHS